MPQSMMAAEAQADGADRISALPDGILRHVLGFLEANEAVRTSVLAQRWEDLWKFMRTLRITRSSTTISSSRKFVDHLLNLRGRSSLDKFLFSLTYANDVSSSENQVSCLNRWTRYALMQEVEELSLDVREEGITVHCHLGNLRVVSQTLAKLQLAGVYLHNSTLDFSMCPALKELSLTKCHITDETDKICSPSLASLRIHRCWFPHKRRVHISTPNLISLEATDCLGVTPIIEYMPTLVTAICVFSINFGDRCHRGDPGYCADASCVWCYGTDDGSAGCVLLRGLSAATNLELIPGPHMFILKRDLRFCPSFSKLKTLLLNEWCVTGDHCALACILQHSPVLEKLTIDLCREQLHVGLLFLLDEIKDQIVPSKAIYNSIEQSFTSEQLNLVEVNQCVFDIMKFLITYGIPLHKISIRQNSRSSGCLN